MARDRKALFRHRRDFICLVEVQLRTIEIVEHFQLNNFTNLSCEIIFKVQEKLKKKLKYHKLVEKAGFVLHNDIIW